jgi:hypothetical protein
LLSLPKNIAYENKNLRIFLSKITGLWSLLGFEASVWIVGLLYLAFIHSPGEAHFSICPLANIGVDFCPGCGLGNSITYLFNGDFVSSFNSHPLGIFALIVISKRIFSLIKNNWRRYA